MNRDELVDAIATVLHPDVDDPYLSGDWEEADRVIDAILPLIRPQVSTVEELEALPKKSIVAAADGSTWFVDTWDDVLTSCCYQDEKSHAELLRIGPLTVVWTP